MQEFVPLNPLLNPNLVKQPTLLDFDDYLGIRQAIFDRVMDAAKKRYPIRNARYELYLDKLRYDKNKEFTPADQKKAILEGGSLYWNLSGDWVLKDIKNNREVARKSTVVARVPWMTERHTFINGGVEYSMASQMRLRPGVYVRSKETGETEAHVNVKPGTGMGFRMHLEPDTGVFRMQVGQSQLKAYPIFKLLGVDDAVLEKHWGKELLERNKEADDPRAASRAFSRLVGERERLSAQTSDVPKPTKLTPVSPTAEIEPVPLETKAAAYLATRLADLRKNIKFIAERRDKTDPGLILRDRGTDDCARCGTPMVPDSVVCMSCLTEPTDVSKKASSTTFDSLMQAKAESDRGNYAAKHDILKRLIKEFPGEFVIDSIVGNFAGLTHVPTGFRIHAPRRISLGLKRNEDLNAAVKNVK